MNSSKMQIIPEATLELPKADITVFLDSYSVSPDRKKLAFFERKYSPLSISNLVIIESGYDPVVIHDDGKWIGVAGWLDDDSLLLERDVRNEQGYISNPVPLVILDYKTGDSRELTPNFPGIYNLYPPIDRWENFRFSEAIYDPLLEFVIYPKMLPHMDALVLWDVKEERQVVNFIGFDFYGTEPKWSPDGQTFVLAKYPGNSSTYLPEFNFKQELFKAFKDGMSTQLTHLTDEYSDVRIGQFSWSPNGSYIAFWLLVPAIDYADTTRVPSDKLPHLAILDMETLEVTNYCIADGSFGITDLGDPYFNEPEAPIWSPDSKKIAIQSANEPGGAVVIVDIAKNESYEISDAGFPIGWLLSDQP